MFCFISDTFKKYTRFKYAVTKNLDRDFTVTTLLKVLGWLLIVGVYHYNHKVSSRSRLGVFNLIKQKCYTSSNFNLTIKDFHEFEYSSNSRNLNQIPLNQIPVPIVFTSRAWLWGNLMILFSLSCNGYWREIMCLQNLCSPFLHSTD